MDKRIATNVIKMLDRVPVTGHTDREAMNEACQVLMEIINAETAPVVVPEQVEDLKSSKKT